MCSHHKPGESYYCVLVLSKHAAACFVGDSHSLLFFVVDALAGAVVLRMNDMPMVAGDEMCSHHKSVATAVCLYA